MNNKRVITIIGIGIVVLAVGIIFYFVTKPRYKCPDTSYQLRDKRCVKTEKSSTYQKLICPEGFVAEDNHCVKLTTKKADYKYECPEGYKNVEQMCQKTLYADYVDAYYCGTKKSSSEYCESYESPKTDYSTGKKYCENGTLKGENCVIKKKASKRTVCPTGYTKYRNKCQKTDSEPTIIVYSCEKGYTLNGKICEYREYKDGTWETACKEGFTLKGNKCIKNINIAATKK